MKLLYITNAIDSARSLEHVVAVNDLISGSEFYLQKSKIFRDNDNCY